MSRDINDDLLPRNVPKPPPLIEAVPKPSVPEVSLLFDQGKGNTGLSQPNPQRVKLSVPESLTAYDQGKSNIVFSQSLPTATRSQEISNRKFTEKEEIPIINRQIESYNVWRSRNPNLISGSKGRVGQSYESRIPNNYNYHSKPIETPDNVISTGVGQPRSVFNGYPSHRAEEVNGITPLDYSSRGHYEIFRPKEPMSVSNMEYVTRLNKQSSALFPSSAHNDTHLPDNEHASLYPAPEANSHVNTIKQCPATSPGSTCDTKYYHSRSADIPCEEFMQRREPHNHSYKKTTHMSPQDTHHYNKDHMFLLNQCKSGCQDHMHNVSQKNVCCSIPLECTSPNSCHSHRQELGHGCHRNFNYTHAYNSCTPVHNHNQSCTSDDVHSMLTDLYSTVKIQTEQITLLQKQVEQLLKLHIDSQKCISCSVPIKKTSENFQNGNSCSPENNIRTKQANRFQGTDKTTLPVIEESEQSTEKAKISVGVLTSFEDPTSKKDTSDNSHCNCSSEKKSSPKEEVQKPLQERPAYYEEPPQHDKVRQGKPVHNMKITRKSHEKQAENKQKLKMVEESFTLNEADLAIDTIAEQALSPASSIHVDMTEYKSHSSDTGSESDYSGSSSSDVGKPAEPEIGWTFYNNVVGQVNKILKKKETPPIDEDVKRATIDYLRHIGISFSDDMDNNVSKRVTFNAADSSDRDGPPDGSLRVNGLPMQHIREDQMMNGQYAHYEPGGRDSRKKISKKTKKKSYDQHQQYISAKRKFSKPSKPSSKILDVEALKQQPKLL